MELLPFGSGGEDTRESGGRLGAEHGETAVDLDAAEPGRLGLELAGRVDLEAAVGDAEDARVVLDWRELDGVDRGGDRRGALGLRLRDDRGLVGLQAGVEDRDALPGRDLDGAAGQVSTV
jgi:hypothetical protein